jgi:hypothetical protein
MNKKFLFAGVLGSGLVVFSLLVPTLVAAQVADSDNGVTTFVQKLAEKLGIDQSTVQDAVDSVHDEIKSEKDAEYTTEVNQSVTDGEITQRQADILLAMLDIEPTKPDATDLPTREEMESMTQEEREAQRETMHTQMQQTIVDALNANGLNTTVEEFQSTQEAARSAGLRGGFGIKGHGRPGMRIIF